MSWVAVAIISLLAIFQAPKSPPVMYSSLFSIIAWAIIQVLIARIDSNYFQEKIGILHLEPKVVYTF